MTTVSLLRELEEGDFDTALFLTYTLGLRFFEDMVLHRLHRLGVARIGIVADEHGYQQSLDNPLLPEGCGRVYLLAAADLPGAFIQHAKLVWLQGSDRQLAYVGSSNVTAAGFNDQFEVIACLDSRIPGQVAAMRDLHATVTRIIPPAMQTMWSHTSAPPQNDAVPTVHFLSSLDEPLVDQLIRYVGSTEHLRVVTPFLDRGALLALARGLSATSTCLDVPAEGADTSVEMALEGLENARARVATGRLKDQRHMHAKAYEMTSARGSWLAIGSANCTQAALIRSVSQHGNLEFLVLVEGATLPDDGPVFEDVLDIAQVPHTGRSWDADHAPRSPLVIESATWHSGRLEICWHRRGQADSDEVFLVVCDQRFPCHESPFVLSLESEPSIVGLACEPEGDPCARAWVVYPDVLEAQVHRRRQQRWAEYLGSEDPQTHAAGFNALFMQMARQVRQELDEDDLPVEQAGFTLEREPSPHLVRQAVETFAFSPDPAELQVTATQLLGSDGGENPFVILHALLARHGAPAAVHIQDDEIALTRHERSHELASRRMAEHLMRYLERLGSSSASVW